MNKYFRGVLFLVITISCYTANSDNELTVKINCSKIKIITSDAIEHEIYCNKSYNSFYENDSIGINDFILHILCVNGCYNRTSIIEDYFGVSHIDSLIENGSLSKIPAVVQEYSFIPINKFKEYFYSAYDFYNTNCLSFEGYKYYCYNMSIFFCVLKRMRETNYKNLNNYKPLLIGLNNYFSKYDQLASDLVLDVIRKSDSSSAQEFLNDKKFESPEFNSKKFKEFYVKMGDEKYSLLTKK